MALHKEDQTKNKSKVYHHESNHADDDAAIIHAYIISQKNHNIISVP